VHALRVLAKTQNGRIVQADTHRMTHVVQATRCTTAALLGDNTVVGARRCYFVRLRLNG
jgi:hypothetical protein